MSRSTSRRAAGATVEDYRRAGTLALNVHLGARQQPLEGFRRWALEQLRQQIDFDSAMWGTTREEPLEVLEVCLFNQPDAMLEQYQLHQQGDPVLKAIRDRPGTTVNLASLMPREKIEALPIYREWAVRFGLVQLLCTAEIEPTTGITQALCLYRSDPGRPFSERDRQIKEFLTPHLLQAVRDNGFMYMGRSALGCDAGSPVYSAAVSAGGVLLQVEPGFTGLLREEWPDWQGEELPEPLRAALDPDKVINWLGSRLHARGQPAATRHLLQLRRRCVLDELSPREREVAHAYADGQTYRQIAEQLSLSPSTVRNHLYAAYRKLGVRDKGQLAQQLLKS